jgi:hypothetical protein
MPLTLDELTGIAQGMAPVIHAAIAKASAPLLERIAQLEDQQRHLGDAVLKYAGIYQRGTAYTKATAVTHHGSAWVALRDTAKDEVPGETSAWQLAVKRGRDGNRGAPSHQGDCA